MGANGENGNNGPHLVIEGGRPIKGTIKANGAKNAALPIMAAAILAPGRIKLNKIPNISDVRIMADLLRYLGAEVEFNPGNGNGGAMYIDTTNLKSIAAPYQMVKKLNASFDITGAIAGRFGTARVPLPGGCVIGTRAVDQHLLGFQALGYDITQEPGGYIEVKARNPAGAYFKFAKTSVGATKNVLMAACLTRGHTILENVAREPEIVDLANFLNRCGARITGQGTERIEVNGVRDMGADDLEYTIIPDRIETGTYMIAAAITGGDLKLTEVYPDHLRTFIRKMHKAGQDITTGPDFIHIKGSHPVNPVGAVITEPYPGFPTDLQPPIVSLLTLAHGICYVKENIFDMRFNYVDDLRRMGADISIDGNTAIIRGVRKLMGAPVDAPDIRAGGALILAALAAEGTSEIYGLQYIDRGYEKIEDRLSLLGASIRRVGEYAHRH